jgi:sugar-specific transcriptional regulator TrmB
MNQKFAELLKNIDLSPTQIKIYLSVLKNGLSSVYGISKDIKINRSQIYLDTNILLDIGLLELASKRVRKFLALDPSKISKIIENKKSKLDDLGKLLGDASKYFDENKKDKKDDYDLRIFASKQKVKEAYIFELEDSQGKDLISITGDVEHSYDFFSEEFWNKFNQKFSESGGRARMLIDRGDKNFKKLKENYLQHNLETRGLENFNLKTNVDVWGENSLLVSLSKNPHAIIIRNKLVADFYRQIFEKLWRQAE